MLWAWRCSSVGCAFGDCESAPLELRGGAGGRRTDTRRGMACQKRQECLQCCGLGVCLSLLRDGHSPSGQQLAPGIGGPALSLLAPRLRLSPPFPSSKLSIRLERSTASASLAFAVLCCTASSHACAPLLDTQHLRFCVLSFLVSPRCPSPSRRAFAAGRHAAPSQPGCFTFNPLSGLRGGRARPSHAGAVCAVCLSSLPRRGLGRRS